jgi:hypothetical protein
VLNEDTKGSTVIAYDLGADLRANNKKKATLITVFDSSYASECEGATTLSFTSFEVINHVNCLLLFLQYNFFFLPSL